MPRPRVHDLDRLLDTAERLVAEDGAVSVRSLASAAGVSNGAIYHAFGSIAALLGRVWLRAATDFLDLQSELADAAVSPEDAVVAAAAAPAVFAERRPHAARMLLTVDKDQLLGPGLPTELADALFALDKRVVALLVRLSRAMWDRRDAVAVGVMTTCVVDLPTAFFRRELDTSADHRDRLAAAVRAVLAVPLRPKG
ncbi:TetR/AcrR family transcriptional regulator [Amycolatopsis tucumanensis]|uniref:TetR/AcrR family transcriptional regulator n=1 Tax=Amycolatopsis tucumanensis TaxID=401106 RepID=A0ABP7HT69_9PSEU|nr:TetR/AcrR family transcriptional regulator [Amycolatopsis tucumanensis]MCF6421995.1 TetR/AcrR family transcriptional regulator [Amycolatopsis tucumanensis]